MSDEPVRAPFANPVPPAPKTEEEIEAEREAERQRVEEEMKAAAEAPPAPPPAPLTDEKTYPTPPTADPKVTHASMSTEELEELGYNQDGQPEGEPKAVEEEQQTDPPEEEEIP